MDGIHDLGGMQGFGAIEPEPNEPLFHDEWERHVFGMTLAVLAQAKCTIDEFRHAIERMSPAHYLASGYYEHWLDALERIATEKGIIAPAELAGRGRRTSVGANTAKGRSARKAPARFLNPDLAKALAMGIRTGAPSVRRHEAPPRFRRGEAVAVRRMHPSGHTRCPRYVRGARGTIERHHGAHVFPDASAHGDPSRADHLYTVAFGARELWGEGEGRVYVDLWESYLEPAGRQSL